uniref:Uncharacterized protein n=1 Tax=Phlebotomus papatasi TaxID=29031 RepID=A0A1B0D838_PHLPP
MPPIDKRVTLKGYITRIEQFIVECKDCSNDEIEIKEVAQYYSKIQEYESQFISIHRNLLKDLPERDIPSEKTEHETIMNRVHAAKSDLLKIYTEVCPLHENTSDLSSSSNNPEEPPAFTSRPTPSILKQPKLIGTISQNTDSLNLNNAQGQGAQGGQASSQAQWSGQDQLPSGQNPSVNTSGLEAALTMLITHQMRAEERNQELFRQLSTAMSSVSMDRPQRELHTNKLPTLEVPNFSGDHTQWLHFKGMFLSIVHNNRQLSNIQKLQYLKSYVSGNALKLIENVPLSDQNYESAWGLLQSQFDDAFTVVHHEIEKFCRIPAITTPDVSSFTGLYATVVSVLDSLDGLKATSRDPWVIYLLLTKLDSETKALWSRDIAAQAPTLDKFLDFLSMRLKSLKLCQPTPATESDKTIKNTSSKPFRPRLSLAAVTSDAASIPCFGCQKTDHRLFRCPQFFEMSPSDRLNLIRRHNLCRPHNTLLHQAFQSSNQSTSAQKPSLVNSASPSASVAPLTTDQS